MDKNVGKKGIAGVSLVEIMISLVLVAFALIAITTVFPRIMGHRKGIYEAEQANLIAMEALEFLQTEADGDGNLFTCAQIANNHDSFNSIYGSDNPIDMGSAVYKVIKENVTCDGVGGVSVDVNTVDVSVEWTKSGKNHRVKITGALR